MGIRHLPCLDYCECPVTCLSVPANAQMPLKSWQDALDTHITVNPLKISLLI